MIKQIEKGKYKVIVDCGFVNGKRRRRCKTIEGTKQDAKILESELVKQVKSGRFIESPKLTLNELADKFIRDYCKGNLKENTIYNYECLLIKIRKELGSIYICNITPYVLQRFYNNLRNEGLSSITVDHYYKLLNNIFERGVKWQFIASNPNRLIDAPKKSKKDVRVYNIEEVQLLLEALEKEALKYRVPLVLCLDTGMRREELNGLMWNDIDLDNHVLHIKRVRIRVGKKTVVTTPKTDSSARKIVITNHSAMLLKELKAEQEKNALCLGNAWKDSGYVFVKENGVEYYPNTLSKFLERIVKKNNLPKITFRELRHTNASLLITKEDDIKDVSVRLGHSNITTTLNIYTHAIEKLESKLVNKMDSIFDGANTEIECHLNGTFGYEKNL